MLIFLDSESNYFCNVKDSFKKIGSFNTEILKDVLNYPLKGSRALTSTS